MFSIPLWLVYALLTGITSNIWNFLARYFLRGKDDPTVFAWYLESSRVLVFGLAALLGDWRLTITPQAIFLLFFMGITELFAIYTYMKMHAYSDLSISTILSRTRMIWIPFLAFFLIGERLTAVDYVGIVILFLGVTIVSAPHKFFVDKGAIYANISAFCIALNIVISKMVIDYASSSVMLFFHALPSALLLPLFMKNARQRINTHMRTKFPLKTFAIILSIISMYLFILGLQVGEASKVNAVYQGMLIFSVLAGIFLLKEKEDIFKKFIGASITVIGVILLSFS